MAFCAVISTLSWCYYDAGCCNNDFWWHFCIVSVSVGGFYNMTESDLFLFCFPADLTEDKLRQRHIDSLAKSNIKIEKKNDLPTCTCYWLPKLHKNSYKSRFISNSSNCSTTILPKQITSASHSSQRSCYKVQ